MNISKNKGKINEKSKSSTPTPPLTLPPIVLATSTEQKPNESKILPSIKDLESELLAKAGKISPDEILKLTKYTRSKSRFVFKNLSYSL